MTSTISASYPNYRAPREHDERLIMPEIRDLASAGCWQPSALQFDSGSSQVEALEFCGKSLQETRGQARREVVELSLRHTSQYLDTITPVHQDSLDNQPLILGGHQPELFHPGVWFKNFLMSSLAQQQDGIAINFLVDNDLCRETSIRVPQRLATGNYTTQSVPFDRPRDAIPWELRRLESEDAWSSFPKRVQDLLTQSGLELALVHDLWADTLEPISKHGNIGLAIAQARHLLEQRSGLRTMEVPLSALVSTRAFARFSIQLMSCLPRFQQIYNSQREAYRKAHKIRSHAHPVPALDQYDGWLEGPWWVYRPEAPRRQRLWIRFVNDQLILSDRAGWQAVIEGRLDCDNAATQWLEILGEGVKLRPRALLTTMYLRLMVSDLFLHGIGGGKYDQLTDSIISEYFGIQPPPFAVATATMHLPFPSAHKSAAEIEAAIRKEREAIWDKRFHAERSIAESSIEAQQLVEEKRSLLGNIPPKGEKWQWHQDLKRVNAALADMADSERNTNAEAVKELQFELRQAKLLESREFSFCLFSSSDLIPKLHALS
ncbi:MAG: hypothetical protein AAF483_06280 [Planctomycetota bacterium]